jgi:phenylalanyl-tRNA synthetase beta subunit
MDKTFEAEEINAVQEQVREELKTKLHLRLR